MAIFNQVKKLTGLAQTLIFGASLLANSAFAFTTTITETYQISEGETVIMAREKLLEKIKQKASRKAGSYISINKSIDQTNQLKETIDVISASLVKVDILNEKNKIVDGAIHLEITAKADVDESVLKARVNAVKDDSKKRQEILNLANQNKKLLKQLEDLTAALLKKDISKEEVTALIDSKNSIRSEINSNTSAIKGVVRLNFNLAMAQAKQRRAERARQEAIKAAEVEKRIIYLAKKLYGADNLKDINVNLGEEEDRQVTFYAQAEFNFGDKEINMLKELHKLVVNNHWRGTHHVRVNLKAGMSNNTVPNEYGGTTTYGGANTLDMIEINHREYSPYKNYTLLEGHTTLYTHVAKHLDTFYTEVTVSKKRYGSNEYEKVYP